MNALAKYAIAAAAVVVVAIVGLNLLGGSVNRAASAPSQARLRPQADRHAATRLRWRPGAGQLRRPSLPGARRRTDRHVHGARGVVRVRGSSGWSRPAILARGRRGASRSSSST